MGTEAPDPTIDAEAIERTVLEVIARVLDRPASEVKSTSSLEDDLGMQSLDYLDIAFSLERKFQISFPRTDFLQRAIDHFGEQNLLKDGVITEFGLRLLIEGMPELDASTMRPGLKATEIRKMFVAGTFVRVVRQLLENKARMNRICPGCATPMVESTSLPEFVCPSCGKSVPLPSGDDVMFEHLVGLLHRTQADGGDAAGSAA